MNKIRTQFLALLAMMLTGTGVANATDYGIFIGEKQITSSNANDVNGDGQFSYNNSTKTLTVTNANLTNSGTQGTGIYNRSVSGLTIKFVGTSRFYTRNEPIGVSCSTTITGTGTLYGVSQANEGFESSSLYFGGSGAVLTINGPKLYFTNKSGSAIYDWKGDCTLKIEGSSTVVSFKTTDSEFAWTHHPLGKLTLGSGLYVTRPYKAYFSSSLKNMTTNGSTACKGDFLISSKQTEAETGYGLYIGETEVTNYNCEDVFGDEMFVYHPDSKELDVRSGTFRNDGTLGSGIQNRGVDGLLIWLTGSNINFYTRQDVISTTRSITIGGPGTLNGTSTDAYGIYFAGDGITCTIDGPTLNLNTRVEALRDYYGTTTLKVEASNYKSSSSSYITTLNLNPGEGYQTVKNLGKLTLGTNVQITTPIWGYYSSSAKTITESSYKPDTPYKGKVTIGVGWPLYIAGQTVTGKNAGGITGNGISGSVSYDSSTKTLTLNNATIKSTDFNPIQNNGINGLNIRVVGTNNLDITNGGGYQLLCLNNNTSITGSGTLNLKTTGRNYCARTFHGSTLTINGPTINGSTEADAFAFYPGNSEKLVISGTSTKVFLTPGDGRNAIDKLSSFSLGSGLYVTLPTGGYYSSSVKSITTNGSNPYQGHVAITSTNPSSITTYSLRIGETYVTSFNANDILGNGQFSYNNSTKTLTVKNANLSNSGTMGGGITNEEIEGLKINLVGNNILNTRQHVIYSNKSFSFTGTGTLTGISSESSGLTFGGSSITCTVDGPSLSFSGKTYGINDNSGTATLSVRGSTTSLTLQSGSNYATVYNLKNMSLSSAAITEPSGGYFSSSLKSITTDGSSAYKGKVVIGSYTDYGVMVAETVVTSLNASDVLGDGCFSYNKSTNTLTVKDANLSNSGRLGTGILNWSNDDLIIKIEGTNTFNTRNMVIAAQASCSITGSGTLTGTAEYSSAFSLAAENMTCTVNGPTLDLTSNVGAAVSDIYKNGTLKVQGSSTSLTLTPGGGHPAVEDLGNLTLSSVNISEPAGAEFSSSLKSITYDGTTPYKGKVIISSKSANMLRIKETYVNRSNAGDILGDGHFSYDYSTKTLTVRNAEFRNDGAQGSGIANLGVDGLTIRFEGTSNIDVRNSPLYLARNTKITGSGTLTGNSWGSSGIMLSTTCDSVIIDGPTLNITAAGYGMQDYASNTTVIVQGNTQLSLESPNSNYYTGIGKLMSLELGRGISINEPAGGYFDPKFGAIVSPADTTKAYIGKVVIGREIYYGLIIAEVDVTSANANDVFGDGAFSYDATTKTLTVKDAFIDNSGRLGTGIDNREVDGLTINFVGTSNFNTRNENICSTKSFTITGDGTLNGYSSQAGGLFFWGKEDMTCTINGPKLNFAGFLYNISDYYHTTTLKVDGSSTHITMEQAQNLQLAPYNNGYYSNYVAVDSLGGFTLGRDLSVVPGDVYYSSTMMTFTADDSTPYIGKLEICTIVDYGIYVAETRVKSTNAADILGDGAFSYDPETMTLNVRNATLYNEGTLGTGISNREVYNLTINLEGTNYFYTRMDPIESGESFNITGNGTLNGYSTGGSSRGGSGIYLYGDNTSCYIEGPKLNLYSTGYNGIRDHNGTASVFVFGKNTRLSLNPGEGQPAIDNLYSLVVDTCLHIAEPEGAYFSMNLKSITVDGSTPYYGSVVISNGTPEYIVETNDSVDVVYHVTSDNTVEVGAPEGTSTVSKETAELEIPETVGDYTVTGIAAQAFEWNYSLSAVYMPATIETIGYGAFNGCSNLRDVYMYGRRPVLLDRNGEPTEDNGAFWGLPTDNQNPIPGDDPTVGPAGPNGARSMGNQALDDLFGGATLHVPNELLDEYNVYPWNSWFGSILGDAHKPVHGDVNGDFIVDVADVASVIDVMATGEFTKVADVNKDGVVDVADIATVIDIMAANARRLEMIYGE